jgi:hypothetical protein
MTGLMQDVHPMIPHGDDKRPRILGIRSDPTTWFKHIELANLGMKKYSLVEQVRTSVAIFMEVER